MGDTMNLFRNMKLGMRLTIYFLIVGILPLGVLGILFISQSGSALSQKAFNQLTTVREIKKSQIESFFAERLGDIRVLAGNPFTLEAAKAMAKVFRDTGGTASGKFTGQTKEVYTAPAAYRNIHDRYFPVFKQYMEEYGYYDIFLMGPKHGDTYFTVTKEADFGQRAADIDSSLRDVWQQAAQSGNVAISDTRPYAPSANAPALFVASPVKENGVTVGVLAFQLSIEAINRIMTERSGMGETGESYLVGPDLLMRSDSYLDPENHSVAASFADPEKGRVDTEAANAAIRGESGKRIIIDYNGNPVLSAYTAVAVGDTTWGLLAEIDEAEAFAAIQTLKWETAVIAMVAALLIAGVAMVISRSISSPVVHGVEMARLMASGDLTRTMDIQRQDEIGALAQALNDMSRDLGQMVSDIVTGTRTLTSSSTRLSTVSDQISKSTGEAADRSTNVSAAAEEMTSSMTSVAAATEQATANIQMIVAAAEEMTATIGEIAGNTARGSETTALAVQQAEDVSTKVGALGRAAEEISNVTDTISDISEQTNLLALNATIEAARAGDAGKGFAVVANEVKNLASQTAKATQEISNQISEMQSRADVSINAVQTISEMVRQISDRASTVAVSAREQTIATNEISRNVQEAAHGTTQVSASISDVTQASNETGSMSTQVLSAANELGAQAKTLSQEVDQFIKRIRNSA
jgi:methyl-accepting chemotaxis protein